MQSAQELRTHYRAVRARLWTSPPRPAPKPRINAALIYMQPIGPPEPWARVIYPVPIGPKLPGALSATTFNRVKEIVAWHAHVNGVTVAEMLSDGRNARLVEIRSELYWMLRKQTTWSLPRIGKYLNRDHTTVLHGIKKHQRKLEASR